MTDKKTAEAAVKAAQKKFDAADRKAQAAREKYVELQREANAAARELNHARTDPALFDDDPLHPVVPVERGSVSLDSEGRATIRNIDVDNGVQVRANRAPEITPEPVTIAESEHEIRMTGNQVTAAEPAPQDAPPWSQPALEQPAAEPAPQATPPKRSRKVGSRRKAPEEQPAAEPTPQAPVDAVADPFPAAVAAPAPQYAPDGTVVGGVVAPPW